MNDATVRFEETPYNFNVSSLFPKIVDDLRDEQGEDGAITCTAPLVYGSRPADPVCSSFHSGNKIVQSVDHFRDSLHRFPDCRCRSV